MLTLHKKHFVSLLALLTLLTGLSFVSAWTGPGSSPPGGNVDAPINVGNTDQIKEGALRVNGFRNIGDTLLSGVSAYLNFGETPGATGYGIRDNAGVMQVKNSGGAWAMIATTTGSGSSSFNLHNNVHTNVQCEAAGGLVRSIGASGYLCQMTGTSCPSGWTRLSNWGVTHPGGGVGTGAAACVSGCITGSHEFSNTAIESCSFQNQSGLTCFPATAQARLEAVGCY